MNPVAPYCGQNQTSQILVPARIAYKYIDWEEGPWGMMPYAMIYPPGSQTETTDVVPPPVKMIDVFSAQQTFPL